MINAESFGEQTVLRFNHVEVTVAREFRVHSVTRLARFAVADAVRQHDEEFRRIERLILPEQFASKLGANELRAATGCPVHDKNGIRRLAVRVFLWFTQCPISETQL